VEHEEIGIRLSREPDAANRARLSYNEDDLWGQRSGIEVFALTCCKRPQEEEAVSLDFITEKTSLGPRDRVARKG
jgi:hypothetical protein